MKKTQIIKNIVGERLKNYGFSYLKTDGPCRIFIRAVDGFRRYYIPEPHIVKQYISIQENNFCKALTVRVYTDVYGHEMGHELEILRRYGLNGWIEYTDEENYKKRLDLLTDLIIDHGLDMLKEMSYEEEVIPTKEMAEKLFDQHKDLKYAFIDEFHIKEMPEKPEEIEEWFQLIKKLLIDTAELPYEDVKELLMKIAAFIGEKFCEMCSYEWMFPKHFKTPEIVGEYACFLPLDIIIDMWKNKCDSCSWERLEEYIGILKQHLVK